ncbi:Pectate lyase H [Fulvia fulva]|nr:Pectate lyase H [Fulvia fulva]
MQYITAAALALAVVGQAAPHFPPKGGYGGYPAAPAPGTGISFPTATGGVALPTGYPIYPTGSSSGFKARSDDDEEEEEDKDEDEEGSSSADEEEEEEEEESSSSDDEEESSSSDDEEESTSLSAASSGTASATATPSSSSSDDEEESTSSPAASSGAASVTATPSSTSGSSGSSSGGKIPASSGSSALDAVKTIAAGEFFDGGMVAYDRGQSCTGQSEGGDSDAVFYLEEGASLSNVIIGPNQIEGVHCFGACKLTNVWWAAVCEDAFTIKEQETGATTTIEGGGAFGAEDKVLQHNGGGTMSVSGFTVESFGKLYRSCGNCKTMYERHVIFNDITATDGKSLAGINSNYGDTATFKSVTTSGVSDICVEYEGNDTGDEPEEISNGPSDACIYSTSDVTSS